MATVIIAATEREGSEARRQFGLPDAKILVPSDWRWLQGRRFTSDDTVIWWSGWYYACTMDMASRLEEVLKVTLAKGGSQPTIVHTGSSFRSG